MPRKIARLLLILMIACQGGSALAAARVALVIGNDAYREVPPLQKAVNDARAMADKLQSLGFEVVTSIDADRREMNRVIQSFVNRVEPGDVAAVFYAGHGVEIDGENYLLPIDIPKAEAGQKGFVRAESIALEDLLGRLRARRAQLNIVFLDACRDNPFGTGTRSLGATRGLGRVSAPSGTFIMYSADAGEAALDRLGRDDPHPNSVFTRTLLPLMDRPDMDLVTLARTVRREVRGLAATIDHQQTPAYYDAVLGTFHFAEGAAPAPQVATATPAAPATSQIEQEFEIARRVGTLAAWNAFLSRHGADRESFFVTLAEAERDRLVAAAPPAVATAPAAPATTPRIATAPAAPAADPQAERDRIAREAAELRRRKAEADRLRLAAEAEALAARARAQAEAEAARARTQGQQPAFPVPAAPQDPLAAVEAFETADHGIRPQSWLNLGAEHGPTPTEVPGAEAITTAELLKLMQSGQPYYLMDVLGGATRIPGAINMRDIGNPGSFEDLTQQQLAALMAQEIARVALTGADEFPPMIVYCSGPQCWRSYNAALRLVQVTRLVPQVDFEIYWYRGGIEAWQRAGGQLVGWN